MGYTAYKVTRPNGQALALIFPVLPEPFNAGTDTYYTIGDLMETFPDFPVEAHVFTAIPDIIKTFGFGNIIDVREYMGETWTMDNGSTLKFIDRPEMGEINRYNFFTYRPDGTQNSGINVTKSGAFLPIQITNPIDGQIVGGGGTYIEGSEYHEDNEFRFPQGEVPSQPRDVYVQFFEGATPILDNGDPYGDGGISGDGGGTGTFDGTGDNIAIPSLPTLSATDAGFITLFNPSIGDMRNLASYMWSDLFDADGWKKIFADPMDAILGLSIVPVAIPSSGSKPVSVGNISTGVSMPFASTQYVSVDCGTIDVKEFWGAYLDYDPYTKAEIYLPYIGIHPIATDDIMNKPVHVVYHVDILSGSCCAYVQCGGTVLYSFIGQCSSSIPITGDNWTNVINGALSIAGSIGTMVATGGASAPMAIGQIASTAVNSFKPSVEKSGAMGGTGGMLAVQTPYLILTRPRQAVPRNQNAFIGYPAFITELLGDLSGYTEIDSIHLENVPATEPELSEIESLLKSGVIL